jgi:hypothetical protein
MLSFLIVDHMMLSVIIQFVTKLYVITLNDIIECYYVECHYTVSHYDERHYIECHYAESRLLCCYAESHQSECHYANRH